ncbi:MAG: FkbM family methyltransferase [Sphingomonas sp.]
MGTAKELLRGTGLLERAAGWRKRKTSHSQFGEDVHILSYYARLAFARGIRPASHACFVDIGGYRPIAESNSYAFHKLGWHCINVDATPGSMQLFSRIRPTDTNLEIAIGETEGDGTFYLFGTPSVWNSFDENAARRAQAVLGYPPREITVPIRPLRMILDQHLNGRALEVLSIDAEGFDIVILRSNDFDRYRPRVIIIETDEFSPFAAAENEVVRFLVDRDYQLYSWINPNLMFVRSDSAVDLYDPAPVAAKLPELDGRAGKVVSLSKVRPPA